MLLLGLDDWLCFDLLFHLRHRNFDSFFELCLEHLVESFFSCLDVIIFSHFRFNLDRRLPHSFLFWLAIKLAVHLLQPVLVRLE